MRPGAHKRTKIYLPWNLAQKLYTRTDGPMGPGHAKIYQKILPQDLAKNMVHTDRWTGAEHTDGWTFWVFARTDGTGVHAWTDRRFECSHGRMDRRNARRDRWTFWMFAWTDGWTERVIRHTEGRTVTTQQSASYVTMRERWRWRWQWRRWLEGHGDFRNVTTMTTTTTTMMFWRGVIEEGGLEPCNATEVR